LSFGGFDDFLTILDESEFEEEPVELQTFVTSKEYMNLPPLSEEQYGLVEKMTQIYKLTTLRRLYGEEEGTRRHKGTVNEVIAQLGKGSGKNFSSTIAVAYTVHKLLCLRDPASYYGKPPGDSIDILNIAINSVQASNVFFKPLTDRLKRAPWFEDKIVEQRAGELIFKKNVRAFSGHSEREGWEGYNLILCILDEISGFALETNSGNESSKTAKAIYDMYKGSVDSRFAEYGKLVLLSFPRFKGDFIQQRYEAVIADKEVVQMQETFPLHDDLDPNDPNNQVVIEWEEDRIVAYAEPKVYALKRPTWKVNPNTTLESLKIAFWRDAIDARSRFACMPPEAIDAFFKDKERVNSAFPASRPSPFEEDWSFKPWFLPTDGKDYYIHVDLGYKFDRAAVAMAHVEEWVRQKYEPGWQTAAPVVKIDCVRYWTPKSEQNVDFRDIRDFIYMLRRRGFNIVRVTFDQWQSVGMIREMNESGIFSDRLSVAKPHYTDLALLIYEARLHGYYDEVLLGELLGLRIIKGDKVDHPAKGSNDLADAVCGAAYNATKFTTPPDISTIEVRYLQAEARKPPAPKPVPAGPMPPEVADFIAQMKVIE
jgi:hypothetical protein